MNMNDHHPKQEDKTMPDANGIDKQPIDQDKLEEALEEGARNPTMDGVVAGEALGLIRFYQRLAELEAREERRAAREQENQEEDLG